MKQGKLIRRAVSAALAGCMMFTFSAPALAESTDALMQLSMTRRSAVSVLDEENDEDVQDYGLEVGGESEIFQSLFAVLLQGYSMFSIIARMSDSGEQKIAVSNETATRYGIFTFESFQSGTHASSWFCRS